MLLLAADRDIESAVNHALHVERHILWPTHAGHCLHYLCIDAIAMSPRLEYDVREHHRLAGFQLHHSRKRRSPLRLEVVTDAFLVVERAVLSPQSLSHPSHAEIGL